MSWEEKPNDIEYDIRENPPVSFSSEEFAKMRPVQMPVGDFRVTGKTLVVENKGSFDWTKCLRERVHIVNQILNMNANYAKSVVVVSGCNQIDYRGNMEHAMLGSLASLVMRSNTSFVPVQNYDQLSYLVQKLFEKAEDGKTLTPMINVKKTVDRRLGAICAFPGIEEVLAKRLLEQFQTIQNIGNASVKELMEVEGIGKGKAEAIWKFVHE